MAIQKLSTLLINQIAAGEVIERPASVVKELVENSLDAHATRIEVLVEQGGMSLIRVSDDGHGIPPDELPLAVAPHATSKLREADDLARIGTLGFRGEALASIASVARVRLTSRPTINGQVAQAAAMIQASGESVGPVEPTSSAPGTVIEVRDLFFNTPARRKFIRTPATEWGHVCEVVTRIAMARPEVAFRLAQGTRSYLDVPAGQSPRQRWVALLGKEIDELLLDFEARQALPAAGPTDHEPVGERPSLVVWGLAGKPQLARATAQHQYLFVNGRVVRDRTLAHAVREAYRGLMAPNQYPVAVLCLQTPSDSVDVNVHPTKAEVRFREPNRLHGLVLTAIRQRLLATDLTPQASLSCPASPEFAPAPAPTISTSPARSTFNAGAAATTGSGSATGSSHHQVEPSGPPQGPFEPPSPASPQAFVDYFRRMEPRQKGLVFKQVQQALAADQPLDESLLESLAKDVDKTANQEADVPPGAPAHAAPTDASPTVRVQPQHAAALAQRVLQVHGSYLVTQDDQGLVIIDQHALHERVMFEQLRARILKGPLESQRLLTPAVLKASPARLNQAQRLGPLLAKLGIEVEPIGPAALAVQAFPSFLFDRHVDPGEFVEALLDRAEAGLLPWDDSPTTNQTVQEFLLHEVLDMMACKAAVKAGDRLTPEELSALLEQRLHIERSSNCPHGRPTSHRITLKELEKRFKRT